MKDLGKGMIEGKAYRYEELCFAEQRLIPDHWPKHGNVRFVFKRNTAGQWQVATTEREASHASGDYHAEM